MLTAQELGLVLCSIAFQLLDLCFQLFDLRALKHELLLQLLQTGLHVGFVELCELHLQLRVLPLDLVELFGRRR